MCPLRGQSLESRLAAQRPVLRTPELMSKGHIDDRLAQIAGVLPCFQEFTFAIAGDSAVAPNGTVMLGRAPHIAPEAYRVLIYPPAPEPWMRTLEDTMSVQIPAELRRVLLVMNGCHCFDLSLFGVTESPTSPLNRREPVALRLAFGLADWADAYGRAGSFYFGGAPWTDEENIGYFWSDRGPFSARTNGEVVGSWSGLADLFNAELARLTARRVEVH